MREQKKSEIETSRAAIMRQGWLERTRECHAARTLLGQLELSLSEHTAALRKAELRCSRFDGDVKRVIFNGGTRCISEDPSVLASQLIAGKASLAAIVLQQQKIMDPDYRRINFGATGSPEEDLVAFKEWDAARASILILKQAVAMAKKAVAFTNKESMRKFANAVRDVRAETAREFLAALAVIQKVVQTDQGIAEGLDAEEINSLSPRPFPLRFLNSECIAWLLDALAEKLIQPADLGGLGLDTVSRSDSSTNVSSE